MVPTRMGPLSPGENQENANVSDVLSSA